jgi:hypothetical protein
MSRIQTSGGNSGSSTTGTPVQINTQILSQNWEVFSGKLLVFSAIDLNSFTFQIDVDATVEID